VVGFARGLPEFKEGGCCWVFLRKENEEMRGGGRTVGF